MTTRKQVRIAEAAEQLCYSRATIYNLLKAGVLPSTGEGKMRRIPVAAIDGLLEWLYSGRDIWEARIDPHCAHRPWMATVRAARRASARPKKQEQAQPPKDSADGPRYVTLKPRPLKQKPDLQ
jgi:excisionase family DNA binding protein